MFETKTDKYGRQWFYNSKDVWCWDPRDQTGIQGDIKEFITPDGNIRVRGPWYANRTSLLEATGVKLERRCA